MQVMRLLWRSLGTRDGGETSNDFWILPTSRLENNDSLLITR